MPIDALIAAIAIPWIIGLTFCLANAYVYDPRKKLTRRQQARWALTGWFLPIALPFWTLVLVWIIIKGIVKYFWRTVRSAFGPETGELA